MLLLNSLKALMFRIAIFHILGILPVWKRVKSERAFSTGYVGYT